MSSFSCNTPSRDGACRRYVAARLTAVARIARCESTRPAMEMFNSGKIVQRAANAHEKVSEQVQLLSSL